MATLEARVKRGLVLPPTTEAVYIGYKDPLRPVEGGYGYHGVVSTDKTNTFMQCHMCGNFFKHLGIHISRFHKCSCAAYRREYGIASSTSLVSPKMRDILVLASDSVSPEVKAKRLIELEKGREINHSSLGRGKSLEQKNKEGRCPDQLIDKIQRLATLLGRTPTNSEFRLHYGGYLNSIYLTYGSWNNAVRVAKLTPGRTGRFPTYTKKRLVSILQDFYRVNGRRPSFSDMRNAYMPSQWTFTKYFGSWSGALNEALNTEQLA